MAKSLKEIFDTKVVDLSDPDEVTLRNPFGPSGSRGKGKSMVDLSDPDAVTLRNPLRKKGVAAKSEDMSKRITERSYEGENVKGENVKADKPVKKVTEKTVTVETPGGLRGSATGEIGPNMGKVNTAAEAYADAQARDAASRITEGGIDYSKMSRTAPEERVDMHEQARRSMGFKKGGAVRKKSGGSCGMKSGGSVKSSASRRADGCAMRGKTRGRIV